MARMHAIHEEALPFDLPQARWLVGVLGMLIAVVGKSSLLGLILGQARSEVRSLLRDQEPSAARRVCPENN